MGQSEDRGLQARDRHALERRARNNGYSRIAGVDEVGRSAWAGPMVGAAVILGEDFDPRGIRSSKEMRVTARQAAYERIMREAAAVAVGEMTAADIDARGIDTCHMELLRDVVNALMPEPDYVLVDHYIVPGWHQVQESINGGDDLSISIAAASIVAKVSCDRIMTAFAHDYPGYGFADNHGYRSDEHIEGSEHIRAKTYESLTGRSLAGSGERLDPYRAEPDLTLIDCRAAQR